MIWLTEGEMARELGRSRKAIRQLGQHGVLVTRRTQRGHLRYSRCSLADLQAVNRLRGRRA